MNVVDAEYQSSAARIFDLPPNSPHTIYRCNWGLVGAGDDVVTHRCSCGGWEGNSIGAVKHADETTVVLTDSSPFPRLRFPEGYSGPRL